MELTAGNVAVVTGAGSGIGLALAERFAKAGLHVVMADVQDDAVAAAAEKVAAHGVETLVTHTDVSNEAEVQALAAAAVERFGGVNIVCNNAGVASLADPWFGPVSSWEWVLGVNLWGVIHGCRAFLPHLAGGGHIVNTASIAGLFPGFGPSYDASKHAVVALTEDLYNTIQIAGLPIGVSVLCPGWVRTNIVEAERNWPTSMGDKPDGDPLFAIMVDHMRRAIAEGVTPASIADAVADAVVANRFWVIPQQDFLDLVIERWATIADRLDPVPPEDVPGLPPRSQMIEEVMRALAPVEAAPE